MVSKIDVSRWTGLTGVEVDSVVRFLEKKDVDWQESVDWRTIGQDVADFADKYDAVWDKLIEHGVVVERPLPVSEIRRKEELWKEEEEEWLLGTKEGVKDLLRRIYKNGLTKKEEERLKEKMLNRPELATLIALYNGEEQDYARRYLAEMVVAPTRKDVKELLKADTIKIRSERGWIKSINDVPVKPLRSIDLVKELVEEDFKLVTGARENGTVAIYSRKKPEEFVRPIPPIPEKPPVEAAPVVPEAKIEELVTQYSYTEVLKMAQEHRIPSGPKAKMLNKLLEKGIL